DEGRVPGARQRLHPSRLRVAEAAAAVHEHDGGEGPRAGGQRELTGEGDGTGGGETSVAANERVGCRECDASAILGGESVASLLERGCAAARREGGEERHGDETPH